MKFQRDLIVLIEPLLQAKPDVFVAKAKFMWEIYLQISARDQSIIETSLYHAGSILWYIALIGRINMDAVLPFFSTSEMRDALFTPSTGSIVCNMLREFAEKNPSIALDWIDDLKDILKGDQNKAYAIASIFGYIGR